MVDHPAAVRCPACRTPIGPPASQNDPPALAIDQYAALLREAVLLDNTHDLFERFPATLHPLKLAHQPAAAAISDAEQAAAAGFAAALAGDPDLHAFLSTQSFDLADRRAAVSGLVATLAPLLLAHQKDCPGMARSLRARLVLQKPRYPLPTLPPPVEMQRIIRGGYAEYVGLSINQGRGTCTGVDFDTRELIRVDSFGPSRSGANPSVPSPMRRHYRRTLEGKNGGVWVQIIRRKRLSLWRALALRRLVTLMHLRDVASSRNPHYEMAMDIHNAVVLLEPDSNWSVGGMGVLHGPARWFADFLNQAFWRL